MKKQKQKRRGTTVTRALESRVRELESQNEYLADDNQSAREGWTRVYAALYPQAMDGPHLGMHIEGSISTILRAIHALRQRAGVPEGKNAA